MFDLKTAFTRVFRANDSRCAPAAGSREALDTGRVAQMSEFLILDQTGLRVTRAGCMRLNAVLERLLA